MIERKKLIGSIALLFSSTAAMAAQPRMALDIGYDFGGVELGEVYFGDGAKGVVRANEGLNLALGVALPLSETIDLQTSIGLQWSEESADNGTMSWQSYPWQTLLVANLGRLSIGGGVVYHFNPQLETTGVLSPLGNVRFDDALGYQAQLAYAFTDGAGGNGFQVGARYTTIDFVSDNAAVRGDGASVFVKFLF